MLNQTRHCSSPSGSVDGKIVVEEDGGEILDLTTLTWQIALGSTLCYRSGGWNRVELNCFHLQIQVRDQQPGGHGGGDLCVPEVHLLHHGQLSVPPGPQLSPLPM